MSESLKPNIPDVFNTLPDELLIKIFSYLPQRELIDSVGNVCLRWQHIATDGSLWRSVHFNGSNKKREGDVVNIEEIVGLLKEGIKLSDLKFSCCGRKEMKQVFKNCVENQHLLQKLSFELCDIHCDALREFALKSPRISIIDIGGNVHFSDPSVLGAFENIRSILYEEPQNYDNLLVIAKSCSNLNDISIRHCRINGEDFNKILKNHPNLKTLYMDYLEIGQNRIFDDFRDNKSITKLTVKNFYTDDHEHTIDYTPLTVLSNLQVLDIDLNYSKFAMGEMFKTISKSISELRIDKLKHGKEPTDRDMLILARRIPNLKSLHLDCTRITDKGIYEYLLKAQKLRKLELSAICCCDQSTKIIGSEWIPYIHKHPGLTELIIKECRLINDESLTILLCTCPHINITTSWQASNGEENFVPEIFDSEV